KLKSYEGTVDRGSTLTSEQLDDYQVGNVVTEKAFTSASRTIPFPGNVAFTIESINGKRIARYSSHKAETEVLFDQGTQFEVLSRDFVDGVWKIKLRELP
ncbi:MAG TPA: ADP-ribosyltransferase domain-containing protein, partial [Verrucomicrobiae bacterium]